MPDEILVTITADGHPAGGLAVNIQFLMERKNHYSFIFGPSDRLGLIQVHREEIEAAVRRSIEFSLMDYVDIEKYWSGTMRAIPVNRERLERAISAYKEFSPTFGFREGYEEMLRQADAALRNLSGAKLEVSVRLQPSDIFRSETETVVAA